MINVNAATVAELESLPGVTAAEANAVVANAPYANLAALNAVIKLPEKAVEQLTFAGVAPSPVVETPPVAPTVSVGPASVTASATADTTIPFPLTFRGPVKFPVTITYATVSGTASSGGGDYLGVPAGTVVCSGPGAEINITIEKSNAANAPKTFAVRIASATGGVGIGTGTAIGTINPPLSVTPPPVVTVGLTPWNLSTPGTYENRQCSVLTVTAPVGTNVVLNKCGWQQGVKSAACNFTATDCAIDGTPAGINYGFADYRAAVTIIQNCSFKRGGGVLVKDMAGLVKTVHGLNNFFQDIQGDPAHSNYRSAFQLQNVLCDDILISENHSIQTPGIGTASDIFSLGYSQGKPTGRAKLLNNYVDGTLTANGSGIMVGDPMLTQNDTSGLYVDAIGNVVTGNRNQGVVMAYGWNANMDGNTVVNDGSTVKCVSVGVQVFDWGEPHDATPANIFATQTTLTNSRVCVVAFGKRADYAVPAIVQQAGNSNSTFTTTEAIERAAWLARGYVVGPRA